MALALVSTVALPALPSVAAAQQTNEQRRIEVARRLSESTVSVVSGPSTGSGFVTGDQRWIVTNSHVIRPARRHGVEVRFSSGTTRRARILVDSPGHDLAVLAVDGEVPARPLVLANSDEVSVGQAVLAFGSPFGLDGTLTQGIVSAIRDVPPGSRLGGGDVRRLIQTDAPINPGNSGGPLVTSNGQVIGVNTAILSRTGGSHGIGFAVPSNHVRALLEATSRGQQDRVAQNGRTRVAPPVDPRAPRPAPRDPRARTRGAAFLGILGDDFRARGVLGVRIRQVVPGSPAQNAGLAGAADPPPRALRRMGIPWTGHIIVAVDGRPTPTMEMLQAAINRRRPGERAVLTVAVGPGADLSGQAVVTLGAAPPPE
ncbi:MAG: S1C family serine protease [Sandaracinaceae bacterium]